MVCMNYVARLLARARVATRAYLPIRLAFRAIGNMGTCPHRRYALSARLCARRFKRRSTERLYTVCAHTARVFIRLLPHVHPINGLAFPEIWGNCQKMTKRHHQYNIRLRGIVLNDALNKLIVRKPVCGIRASRSR